MAGYTRNDASNNIADGNIINASDLDGEFDAIVSAFNASTGHTHDGTSAEGAPIEKVGPVQDLVITATEVKPKTSDTLDLGTNLLKFKDLFIDGDATLGGIIIDNAGTIGSVSDTDAIAISSGGVVTFSQAPVVNVENATTNAVTDVLTLRTQSTGTPAVGIGAGMLFSTETAAGTLETGGAIRIVTTGLTPTDEEIDLVFYSMRNGSLTEAFRYDSDGDTLDVTGTVTADENITIDTSSSGNGLTIQSSGNTYNRLTFDANRSASGNLLGEIMGEWNGTQVAAIRVSAGSDTVNKDDGQIYFLTNPDGTGNRNRVNIANNGDISFYEDTGVTAKFFWDASAESLGIGTSSPNGITEIVSSATGDVLGLQLSNSAGAGSDSVTLRFRNSTSSTSTSGGSELTGLRDATGNGGSLIAKTASSVGTMTERMRIDSSGNVGIGTSSPAYNLEVAGSFPSISILDTDTTNDRFRILHNGGSSQIQVDPNNVSASSSLLFSIDGSEAMRIDSSGT